MCMCAMYCMDKYVLWDTDGLTVPAVYSLSAPCVCVSASLAITQSISVTLPGHHLRPGAGSQESVT